jgi:hypothetical protein
MTWLGGFVLGLGVLVVAALAGHRVRRMMRRRAAEASDAKRLDAEAARALADEIGPTADALIREHGAGAVIQAAKRVLPTLDERDRKGLAVWQRVLQSAEESLRKEEQQKEAAE